ncbi:hypothetical protein Tco_0651748 [Tanacetum coccineum]|uniref:Uncharacterized protein n=1 Tax=Tanacetum coccineum TaxID=301880 RepID=A0ABQ4WVM8_9ASTR
MGLIKPFSNISLPATFNSFNSTVPYDMEPFEIVNHWNKLNSNSISLAGGMSRKFIGKNISNHKPQKDFNFRTAKDVSIQKPENLGTHDKSRYVLHSRDELTDLSGEEQDKQNSGKQKIPVVKISRNGNQVQVSAKASPPTRVTHMTFHQLSASPSSLNAARRVLKLSGQPKT